MTSFKEFLEDYEKKENERNENFLKDLKEGKISNNKTNPLKSRFIKLKEPIATKPAFASPWSIVPFYGSTIVTLVSRNNKQEFDKICKMAKVGFSSKNIDEIIDLVKNTGRIQLVLQSSPTSYKNLDFLEPIFREIKPPIIPNTLNMLIEGKKLKKYSIEFDTLANLGFSETLRSFSKYAGIDEIDEKHFINRYFYDYCSLKFLGYNELVDEIENLMIDNHYEAARLLAVLGHLITAPSFSPLKEIHNYCKSELTLYHDLIPKIKSEQLVERIPCEIGTFILKKLVRYSETLNGCWEIIQHYDDNDLYKVLHALNDGVKKKNYDVIIDKKNDMDEIFDTIWKETDKIRKKSNIARIGIGLIGPLSTNFSGIGILAGLGFSCIDKVIGLKSDSIGGKIAKIFSPNYLVSIYDFKIKYDIKK